MWTPLCLRASKARRAFTGNNDRLGEGGAVSGLVGACAEHQFIDIFSFFHPLPPRSKVLALWARLFRQHYARRYLLAVEDERENTSKTEQQNNREHTWPRGTTLCIRRNSKHPMVWRRCSTVRTGTGRYPYISIAGIVPQRRLPFKVFNSALSPNHPFLALRCCPPERLQ